MKRLLPILTNLRTNRSGQATTELAIAGTIVIMALAYLVQYGYIYNARQSLEMYTFRKALELSRNGVPGISESDKRGISLTVIRDVITPSFFSGISRQRLVASSSVEYNPYILWTPKEAKYVGTLSLLQVNDAMIRRGIYFQIPPMKTKVIGGDNENTPQNPFTWAPSSVAEFDSQAEPQKKTSVYSYVTTVTDDNLERSIVKQLTSNDTIPMKIVMESEANIEANANKDDWDDTFGSMEAYEIPNNVNLTIQEEVRKNKDVRTLHD